MVFRAKWLSIHVLTSTGFSWTIVEDRILSSNQIPSIYEDMITHPCNDLTTGIADLLQRKKTTWISCLLAQFSVCIVTTFSNESTMFERFLLIAKLFALPFIMTKTGNHYKWDWPKSQFSMPNDSATVVWLRNLKVGNVYLFNFLQNALKKFFKMGNKKFRKRYFS